MGFIFGLFFLWWLFFSDPHTFDDDELDELIVNEWNDGYVNGYNNGYNDGQYDGENDGYRKGKRAGYANGVNTICEEVRRKSEEDLYISECR